MELLGRGIHLGAGLIDGTVRVRHEPEVHQADASGRLEDDVLRLDVPMDEAAAVDGAEDSAEAGREVERVRLAQRPAGESRAEGLALDELHDQIGDAVDLADLHDPRQAGILDAGERHRLPPKPARGAVIRPSDLDRAGRPPAITAVDDGGCAAAELLFEHDPGDSHAVHSSQGRRVLSQGPVFVQGIG